MNRRKIEEYVEKIVLEIIKVDSDNTAADGAEKENGKLELVDVEYVKERDYYLRVFLDKENGIELDDCQWVSERLEEKLDKLDIIKEKYYLEVSSPGLDRHLKKERDFIRHKGDMVEIKLYEPINGEKTIIGKLIDLTDGVIHIDANKNKPDEQMKLSIPQEKTASIRLHIVF